MNNKHQDALDQEIAQLYQQRKQNINAPEIDTASLAKHSQVDNKSSWLKPLLIMFGGGFASFGIMAIISHLSTQTPTASHSNKQNYAIEISAPTTTEPNEDAITIKTPAEKESLPAQPSLPARPKSLALLPNEQLQAEANITQLPTASINQESFVLPKLAISEPVLTYKVLPKYSYQALQNQHDGAVTLGYEINKQGQVINIELLDSNVNHQLQRSAKRALAKWRFQASDKYQGQYQVKFEFTLPDSKS